MPSQASTAPDTMTGCQGASRNAWLSHNTTTAWESRRERDRTLRWQSGVLGFTILTCVYHDMSGLHSVQVLPFMSDDSDSLKPFATPFHKRPQDSHEYQSS